MLKDINGKLETIRNQVEMLPLTKSELKDIERELDYEERLVNRYLTAKIKAEKELNKFNGLQLQNIIHSILGSKENKINEYEKQIEDMQDKLNHHRSSLDNLKQRKYTLSGFINSVESQYYTLLDSKKKLINHFGSDTSKYAIESYEDKIKTLETALEKIEEDRKLIKAIIKEINYTYSDLDDAELYSTIDLISNNTFASVSKRFSMNDVEQGLDKIYNLINRLNYTPDSIENLAKLSRSSVFEHSFDIFCDNVIGDLIASRRIDNYSGELDNIKGYLNKLESKLDKYNKEVVDGLKSTRTKYNSYLEYAV